MPAPAPTRILAAEGAPRGGLAALCITQTTGWGVLYYALIAAVRPISEDTGWDPALVMGAFSAGLLVSAAAGILASRSLWLSKISTLNDTSEISVAVRQFKARATQAAERLPKDEGEFLRHAADQLDEARRTNICVASFGEEDDQLEHWRSYANDGRGIARAHDLEVALTNIYGELLDLQAGGLLSDTFEADEIIDRLQERYDGLWAELTGTEEFEVQNFFLGTRAAADRADRRASRRAERRRLQGHGGA